MIPFLLIFLLVAGGASGAAQQPAANATAAPERKTMRAVRTAGGIVMDGLLDEPAWGLAEPAMGFVQSEPDEDRPATEDTEVRILYTADNLYIGVICRDEPGANIIVNSLKKDFLTNSTDTFEVILDTYHDERNGYVFATNPEGARRDSQTSDEGRTNNADWDTVWDVRTHVSRGGEAGPTGWSAEMVIPFKSLSFDETRAEQVWGINFLRRVRRKNELDYWAPIPRRYNLNRLSLGGTLTGLNNIERGRNLRIKPYAAGELSKFFTREDVVRRGKLGLDVKYSVTPSLTLDLTANTDFSQVEVDEQQVNLTRFSLFFPEKREFFLENDGMFRFGDIQGERGPNRSLETQLFFSRRIGLDAAGTPIPIWGGARLSGKVGRYSIGVLNMQTKDHSQFVADFSGTLQEQRIAGDNYAVVRVKRELFANSDIGAIFINRQAAGSQVPGSRDFNRTEGVDANLRFHDAHIITAFLGNTQTDGLEGDALAQKYAYTYHTSRWKALTVWTDLAPNFNPEVGFTQRTGTRYLRHRSDMYIHPGGIVRQYNPHVLISYFFDEQNRRVTSENHYALQIFFQNGSHFEAHFDPQFERLDAPFDIRRRPLTPAVTIPAGESNFYYYALELGSDPSKVFSGDITIEKGPYYSGNRNTVEMGGTIRPSYRFVVEPKYSINRIALSDVTVNGVAGRGTIFSTHLASARVSYYFSTRMYLSALLQYNSDRKQMTSNVRFNFIHRPLSDLFLVYNEARDAAGTQRTDKTFSVKYTHMIAY